MPLKKLAIVVVLIVLGVTASLPASAQEGQVPGSAEWDPCSHDPNNLTFNCNFDVFVNLDEGTLPQGWQPFIQTGRLKFDDKCDSPACPGLRLCAIDRPFVAGIYQQVPDLTPGVAYAARILWAPASGDGTGRKIGIDPTGGTDPASPAIVWSPEVTTKDRVPAALWVSAVAQNTTVTVFVRVNYPGSTPDGCVWLDMVGLVVDPTQPPPAPPPPTSPPDTPTPVPPTPTPAQVALATPPAGSGVYVVQEGDTLSQIAAQFGITMEDLMAANGLTEADIIHPGQELIIPGVQVPTPEPPTPTPPPPTPPPGATVYVVQEGDTLIQIAAQFGVTVEDIMAANGLTDAALIQVGQELIIPVSASPTEPLLEPTGTPPIIAPPTETAVLPGPTLPVLPTDTPSVTPTLLPTSTPEPTPTPTATPRPPLELGKLSGNNKAATVFLFVGLGSFAGAGILGVLLLWVLGHGGEAEQKSEQKPKRRTAVRRKRKKE